MYWIGLTFTFLTQNFDFSEYVIIFGADSSPSTHDDNNKKKIFEFLKKGQHKDYSIYFTKSKNVSFKSESQ